MKLVSNKADLNGEIVNQEEALNGAEPAFEERLAPTANPGRLDFNALRLSRDYTQTAGVEKLLTMVPVRKPTKTEFVRVHPKDWSAEFTKGGY